jgi:polysaccharide deacetylase family protein (PEP-CTERM system associated)
MLNALTIDLEDYFQVHAFSNVVRFEDWSDYPSRIEHNTHRLLAILNGYLRTVQLRTPNSELRTPVRATFFVLGWLAERYPNLIRTIKEEGHEIACHGYSHKLIYTQSKEEFREDVRKAKAILEDITGSEVVGYRAPSYSITSQSQWAFEVLMEEGFKYDSSIFPIHHDFYGSPEAPRFPFLISFNGNNNYEFQILNLYSGSESNNSITQLPCNSTNSSNSTNPCNPSATLQHSSTAAPQHGLTPNSELPTPNCLLEFPLSTVRIFGANLPVAGGGYFRLFPYSLIKKGLRRINDEEKQPFVFYIHPWELDPDQPRLNSVSFRSRLRHYVNLHKTESRFKKLLSDFNFSSVKEVLKLNRPNKLNERQHLGTAASQH